ncbi:MAG: RNA methyltransferase [Candidatus Kapabacteria bacterium]|nr:RNA methyltransferase [Candidatus Kapabacteria bacterium]
MPSPENITPERKARIERVLHRRQPTLTVVFENVQDPHNISAVIRSCDAVGVLEVHGIYAGLNEFPILGEKSSASARKWVGVNLHHSVDDCYSILRHKGFRIFTTHMSSDAVNLHDIDLTQPVALVFGNEHAGVTEEARTKADGNFLVPQVGMIQSLNISVACAVTLYEAMRQRNASGMYDAPQIAEADLTSMIKDWCSR